MLERFKGGYERTVRVPGLQWSADSADDVAVDESGSAAEREAVLELLVATMFSDALVTEDELSAIQRAGEEHGWNTSAFSFDQAMGAATAVVRDAREQPNGLDQLLASASRRITTPDLRAEVVEACRQVAVADGTTDPAESAWLRAVAERFSP